MLYKFGLKNGPTLQNSQQKQLMTNKMLFGGLSYVSECTLLISRICKHDSVPQLSFVSVNLMMSSVAE